MDSKKIEEQAVRQRNGERKTGNETLVTEKQVHMKREVGLVGGISMIVGTIIGSGIFITPTRILQLTGSVGFSLIVWVCSGLIASIGAICYAELGLLIPKSGGEYTYMLETLGPIPAFLFAWTNVMVLRTTSIGITVLTFAKYMTELLPIPVCGEPEVPTKLVAAVLIVALMLVNCYSVRVSTQVQIIFTIAKLAALAVIIVGGLVQLARGDTYEFKDSFKGTTSLPSSIALAFYQALWAYDGWNTLNSVTEEIYQPEKIIPRANISASVLVTVVYLLTNISYMAAMSSGDLLNSSTVVISWGDRVLKGASAILPVAVLLSTIGSANGTIFSFGRVVYAAAREGHLPELLSFVHVKRLTPVPSIIFTCCVSLGMICISDIDALVDLFSFTAWIFYGLAVSTLLVLRYSKRDIKTAIKTPIILPIFFVICSTLLVIVPMITAPKLEFLYASLFMMSGLVIYVPLVYFKLVAADRLTVVLQLFFEVAPSPYLADEFLVCAGLIIVSVIVPMITAPTLEFLYASLFMMSGLVIYVPLLYFKLVTAEQAVRQRNGERKTGNETLVTKEQVHMKREVGLVGGISMIVGTIIGSGIFITPTRILQLTGSVGFSLTVWVCSGLIASIGAICYAELGLLIPKSGGEYTYMLETLGPIPAFLFAWTNVMVLRTTSIGIKVLTFAKYMIELLPILVCGEPEVPTKLVAAVLIVALMLVNCYSVRVSTQVQIIFTVAKLAALAVIIVGGLVQLTRGDTYEFKDSFKGTSSLPSSIALAFYQALWAYDGWNNLNSVTEEIYQPEKIIPRANISATLLVTVVYLLTNISYMTAMSSEDLLNSSTVVISWGDRVLKGASAILLVAVLLSTLGSANGTIFSFGRVVYAAAREGHLPELLSFVHVKRLTPVPSIIFTCCVSLGMICISDIDALVDLFSFTAWIFYGLAVSTLLVLRYSKRDIKTAIKTPIIFPIFFVICSTLLVIVPMITAPKLEFLYASLFMMSGLVIYVPLVYFKLVRADRLTVVLQLFFEVAPSPYLADE